MSKIMREPEFAESFKAVYVNCTAIKSGGAIYGKIVDDLGIERSKTEAGNKTLVEKYIASKRKTLLLILDEIDQLSSRKHLVLYSIFEWPSKPDSKLVLIGIANALDLTDRILPRLRARCGLKPRLMHFAPYSKEQIVEIISKRLGEANVSNVLNASAVQMLAAKVAAISGDIRKALDIGRRVIEIADARRISQVLQPSINNGYYYLVSFIFHFFFIFLCVLLILILISFSRYEHRRSQSDQTAANAARQADSANRSRSPFKYRLRRSAKRE